MFEEKESPLRRQKPCQGDAGAHGAVASTHEGSSWLNGGEIRQCAGASRQTDGLPEGKRMPSQGALKKGIPSSTSKEWAWCDHCLSLCLLSLSGPL